jgi:hypothetical protein
VGKGLRACRGEPSGERSLAAAGAWRGSGDWTPQHLSNQLSWHAQREMVGVRTQDEMLAWVFESLSSIQSRSTQYRSVTQYQSNVAVEHILGRKCRIMEHVVTFEP